MAPTATDQKRLISDIGIHRVSATGITLTTTTANIIITIMVIQMNTFRGWRPIRLATLIAVIRKTITQAIVNGLLFYPAGLFPAFKQRIQNRWKLHFYRAMIFIQT